MQTSGSMMFFVGLGILIMGCLQNDAAPIDPGRVVTLDKHSKTGRKFMYLDGAGEVVYTTRYQDIPKRFRNAVVVLDQTKPKPRPRKLRGEEKRGFLAGQRILRQFPPASQDQEELRRELLELRREQRLHESGR